jgi:Fic family protein
MKRNPKLKDRNPINVLVSEFLKEQSHLLSREKATELVNRYQIKYPLSDRQSAALKFLLIYGELTNALYVQVTHVSKATAKRDLAELIQFGLLQCIGKGPVTSYKLLDKIED